MASIHRRDLSSWSFHDIHRAETSYRSAPMREKTYTLQRFIVSARIFAFDISRVLTFPKHGLYHDNRTYSSHEMVRRGFGKLSELDECMLCLRVPGVRADCSERCLRHEDSISISALNRYVSFYAINQLSPQRTLSILLYQRHLSFSRCLSMNRLSRTQSMSSIHCMFHVTLEAKLIHTESYVSSYQTATDMTPYVLLKHDGKRYIR